MVNVLGCVVLLKYRTQFVLMIAVDVSECTMDMLHFMRETIMSLFVGMCKVCACLCVRIIITM